MDNRDWERLVALRTVYGLAMIAQANLLLLEKARIDDVPTNEFIASAKSNLAEIIKTLDGVFPKRSEFH